MGFTNSYRFDEWDVKKRSRRLVFEPRTDWFQPWDSADLNFRLSPPPPMLIGMQTDSANNLWTLSHVAGKSWLMWRGEPPRGATAHKENGNPVSTEELQHAYDTVIEVFSPKSRQLLASRRLSGMFLGFSGPGSVALLQQVGEKQRILRLYTLSLDLSRRPSVPAVDRIFTCSVRALP
jgi:hypothetical protein